MQKSRASGEQIFHFRRGELCESQISGSRGTRPSEKSNWTRRKWRFSVRHMDLPRRFAYGPQWQQIMVMFALGAVMLVFVSKVSLGFGLALSFLPLSFALMGTVRKLFLPRFLQLGQDTLSISTGFLQTRVTQIPYAGIEQTSEVRRGRMTTFYLRTKERPFEINSILLPNMASYVAVRDFINSRVAPKEKNALPIEAGKYCFRCSYEGNGEIYDSNGGILWRFKTLH